MSDMNDKKRKQIICAAIILLLIGLMGGGWWWYQSTRYISTDDARISGTIVNVSAKIPSSRITEVLVKEGDKVTAGQVLAKIDARDIAAQKAQAQAALAAAKARYAEVVAGSRPQEIGQAQAGVDQARAGTAQAQANLDNAALNYTRMQKLYDDGAISASQRDNAQTTYEMAREAVRAAKESVNASSEKLDLTQVGSREETIKAAEAQVKQAEAALEAIMVTETYSEIVSPVTGIIALKSVNSGEVVAAGQPLFSIVDCNDVWLNARIEETKIGKIKIGQTVDYTIDGYPDRTFTGTVYDIGIATNSTFALIPTENSSGNFTKVTQRVPIKITLPENINDIIFRPGMQSIVKIHLN